MFDGLVYFLMLELMVLLMVLLVTLCDDYWMVKIYLLYAGNFEGNLDSGLFWLLVNYC